MQISYWKMGIFPIKHGDFPIKHGDFPIENGDVIPAIYVILYPRGVMNAELGYQPWPPMPRNVSGIHRVCLMTTFGRLGGREVEWFWSVFFRGVGFKHFYTFFLFLHRSLGKWFPFDEHIFQMGWFKHQLVLVVPIGSMWQVNFSYI